MIGGIEMFYRFRRPVRTIPYDRDAAVGYAHQWAYSRNPAYYDFENIGGDCTNFTSQVIFAGSGIMNFTPDYGWYYASSYDRTASWTGVNFLYKFLVNNDTAGPYAEVVDIKDAKTGDIAQLSLDEGEGFQHSPVIVQTGRVPDIGNILVAAHTFNADYYPLKEFKPREIRFLHIMGVRKW